MKFERISETQIKCTLTSFDLSVRNLNLGELAYGGDKARSLFQEMVQRARTELGFDAEDMPLMIEAVPLGDESIVLMITKIEDPEEIDTRFARFAPQPEEQASVPVMGEPLNVGLFSAAEEPGAEGSKGNAVFAFDSLDMVSDAAKVVGEGFTGLSSLYKSSENKTYYLMIESAGCDKKVFASTCNLLSEYGRPAANNYSSKAYFREHYELIIADKALKALAVL